MDYPRGTGTLVGAFLPHNLQDSISVAVCARVLHAREHTFTLNTGKCLCSRRCHISLVAPRMR